MILSFVVISKNTKLPVLWYRLREYLSGARKLIGANSYYPL